jgi:hypothetical protein
MEGEGFLTDLKIYLKNTSLSKLRARPKILNDLLTIKGNVKIIKVSVCRKELSYKIRWLMDTFTFGELKKRMKKFNFDKLYHLYLKVYLEDGTVFGIEKNERVKIFEFGILQSDFQAECKSSKMNVSLLKFIENGEKKGGKEFYRYSAHKNNCQKFANDLLLANGVNLSKFIMQDVEILLTGRYKSIFQGITDFAGLSKYVIQGGSEY